MIIDKADWWRNDKFQLQTRIRDLGHIDNIISKLVIGCKSTAYFYWEIPINIQFDSLSVIRDWELQLGAH